MLGKVVLGANGVKCDIVDLRANPVVNDFVCSINDMGIAQMALHLDFDVHLVFLLLLIF